LVVNGILISLFEGTRRDQQTIKDLNNQFSGLNYRNRIRFDPEILKAEVKRAPSTLFNRATHSTQDYIFLTAELLGRIHRQRRLPDADFSFDTVTQTITETLAKPEFTTVTADPDADATGSGSAKPGFGLEGDAGQLDPKTGKTRQLVMATVIFLAGMLCGGSLATWLGPAAATLFQTAANGN
jgi:chromosome partitioning protein